MISSLLRLLPGSSAGSMIKCVSLVLLLCLLCGNLYAGEIEDRRIWAGLDLFPSLLAADQDIATKRGPDGTLLLVLVYVDRKEKAEEMALSLGEITNIRGIPIRLEVTNDTSLKTYADHPPAGIFLTQHLTRLNSVIRYGIEHHVIVFSPFEEDVKRGVLGGIIISDRILPYINMETMRSARIRVKPFFLRISERYE